MTDFARTLEEATGNDRARCSMPIVVAGKIRTDLECPNNRVDFTVQLSRQPVRKARLACSEHLAGVIWDLQWNHGMYEGEYVVTATPFPWPLPRVKELGEAV